MGITNFDQVKANAFIGSGIGESSPFATTYYVDGSNGSDGNSGETPDEAFKTLAVASAATTASRGDKIIIAPGTYTITAALVPLAGNIFEAAVLNTRTPSVIITGNIADLVQIDVSNVKFIGIKFYASGTTADNLVDISDTASVNGPEFYHCTFDGQDKTSVVGIQADDATYFPTGLVVKGCLFKDLTGTCIDVGVKGIPYAEIQYNQFAIDVAGGTGIALADTSAFATGKAYKITDNWFTGIDSTADEVGITISGTENTTGAGIIADNRFAYMAAAAITADKLSKSEVWNYVGDADTGGTLVDPGT